MSKYRFLNSFPFAPISMTLADASAPSSAGKMAWVAKINPAWSATEPDTVRALSRG